MSKRKKLRTSGEGIHPQKPTKNPRLKDPDGVPQNSNLGPLYHPEESEGRSGPAISADQSEEEPGQAASSSLDKETEAPSRFLGQPEKEPIPFPSQNSVGRFVPQFAKSRKIVTRQAAMREEDLRSGTFNSEISSAQQAESQLWEESPGLNVWEAKESGDQTQADGICSKHSIQNPVTPLSRSGDSQPEVSNDTSPEWGTVPLATEKANQDRLLEQRTNLPDGSTEGGGIPSDHGQKGHQLSSDAEEKEADQGTPQEEGAWRGVEADQEEGEGIPGPISVAQGPPDPVQTLSMAAWKAEGSCSSSGCSSLATTIITDMSKDTTKPEQRSLEVVEPDGKANAGMPASPSGKDPDRDHSRALLRGMPLSGETTGGRGEAGQEAEAPDDVPGGSAASLALAHGIQEPKISAGDSSPVALEMGPGVDQTQVPDPDQEGLGDLYALSLLSQPSSVKAAELGSQSREQDLVRLSLSLGASALLVHREAVDGPPLDTKTHQGNPDVLKGPAGQPNHPPDSADQAVLGGSLAMELDFLLDSQIQDALEAPDFEAPLEQLFPARSGLGSCCPGTSLLAHKDPLTKAQPSTYEGINPCEAARMEDATDTIHGLVVELSNLNRLIMNTHRDLEAFKRFNHRKAKSVVKAPMPYTSKGAGTLPRGEQSWRDL